MLGLLAALSLQLPGPCPRAGAAAAEVEAGWRTYRRGAVAEAARSFAAADSLCPGHHGAQVGLGFALLRQGRTSEAESRLVQAVGADSSDADAWYGLGLARARLGDRAQAVRAWRRVLRIAPEYADAADQLLALGIDSGLVLPPPPPPPAPAAPQVPARAVGEQFEVGTAAGWRPFYVRGVNLGPALPGKFPSEAPTDDSTYARWLQLIAEANANTVRLYTILPPAFYRALKRWNDANPVRALWLVHGVWAELPPEDDYDHPGWKSDFRAEMRRVVDLVHGRALIAARPGHAFGRYDADVSAYVLAYIVGREWEPFSIRAYNAKRRARTAYAGRFLVVDRGTPADAWMAEQCDSLLSYEWDTYHAQRPIAYTNWPTLDPLRHPTEPTQDEEQALRRRHGFPPNPRLKEYDNDRESLDAMVVRTTPLNVGGYFASYHAYPYYPDFIGLDATYAAASTRYLGYLLDLKRHHAGRALLIAEYGIPSSRGTSHLDPDGRHHGGHDERAMAEHDARLTREIREAGAAGGILFAWLDEWFKHTWVTIDLEAPAERTRLWHNVENAEQSYGLLGAYAGDAASAPEPGGDAARWRALAALGRTESLALRVGADPSYLHVALDSGPGLESARYVIGIDTYRPDRGERLLPGLREPAAIGFEFALVLNDTSDAQLLVAPWYNPYLGPREGIGPTGLDRFYNERVTVDASGRGRGRGGIYDSLFVATNRWRIGRDGRTYPARGVNRGRLRHGRAAETSLADWYVDRAGRLIEVRIPWALLNVTDPSSRRVMIRYSRGGTFDTAVTDGFRFVVAALDRTTGAPLTVLRPAATFAWPGWEVPTWHERLKPAYFAMREVWGGW